MTRLVPVLVVVLALLAPSARAAQRCTLPGAKFIAKSSQGQLFSVAVKGKGAVKRRYFGCRNGHKPLLLTEDIVAKTEEDTAYGNSTFRIGGTWAGWVETTSSASGLGSFSRAIHVRSLAGVKRQVDVFTADLHSDYGVPTAFKLGSDGALAFILPAVSGPVVEVDGVAATATEPVALAYGRDIDKAALLLGGGKVTFTRAGKSVTLPLAAPPARPSGNGVGPEGLDGRFGDCGTLVPAGVKPVGAQAVRLARAPDGKIVTAGTTTTNTGDPVLTDEVVVARFSADGTFDQGFGQGGSAIVAAPKPKDGQNISVAGLVVQADGRVVVAENAELDNPANSEPVLLRFDTAGKLDASFGSAGVVRAAVPSTTSAQIAELALAPDGGIVATGQRDGHWFIARFGADGKLDPAFGKDGLVADTGTGTSIAHALAIAGDGTIAIGGADESGVLFARFDAQGKALGATAGSPPAGASIFALALMPDGGYAAAGSASNITGTGLVLLAHYLPGGALDSAFGSAGFVIDRDIDTANDVAVLPDGHWLVSGAFTFGGDGITRFNADGSRDGGFGYRGTLGGTTSYGMVDSDILAGDDGTALVAQKNGLAFAISRFAVGDPAVAATAGEASVCAMLVAAKKLAPVLKSRKLDVGLRLRKPGRVHLHGTVTVAGKKITLGDVTFFRPTDEGAVGTLPISKAAAAALAGAKQATITITGGAPGGPVTTYKKTLRS